MNAVLIQILSDVLEIQEDHLAREGADVERYEDALRISKRLYQERIAKVEALKEALANAGTD